MTCTVKLAGGKIVLPPGLDLPDGTKVQLTIPDSAAPASFADRYAACIGAVTDLPADLAVNLDHYPHRHRKP